MKKIFLFLLLVVSFTVTAQKTYSIEKPLQLNTVNEGAKSDSVLVRGTDKIVKYVPRSEFGGIVDLSYLPSPTNGTVLPSSGTPATVPLATTANAGLFSPTEKTKLDGIATGATANQTDAYLLNRANQTGSQAIATVTGLQTALDGKQSVIGFVPENVANKQNTLNYDGTGTKYATVDAVNIADAQNVKISGFQSIQGRKLFNNGLGKQVDILPVTGNNSMEISSANGKVGIYTSVPTNGIGHLSVNPIGVTGAKFVSYQDNLTERFSVLQNGDVMGGKFIKFGGLPTQYLMADGSVSTLEALSGSSGTFIPESPNLGVHTLTYSKSYWVKVGNIVTITLNYSLAVTSLVQGLSFDVALPNSFRINSPVDGRLIGISNITLSSNSGSPGSVCKVFEGTYNNTVNQTIAFNGNVSANTYYSSIVFSIQVN
ncbi:hypothetical protein [Flavobacterium sp. AJR]|jgi:hypothetical protein|uniref:hypothetical protein n=1 Tax=Flavobacterium sp. AJR TaxID=1979369 RepID=UPI000A3D723E|nr:hypothetical protein [Flavobacterium sp. AJR]OUL63092.1 hypothetical protein B8T70_06780 [Flavobacterium sp. AJR]